MTKADARKLVAGIIPDGLRVQDLTPTAKQEKRDALDVVLKLANNSKQRLEKNGMGEK